MANSDWTTEVPVLPGRELQPTKALSPLAC